jgi:anti-anti-sigma factor
MRAHGPVAALSGPAPDPGHREEPSSREHVAPRMLIPYRVVLDGDRIVLEGSVDTFTADRLAVLLADTPTGVAAVLDLVGLEFIDVAGCRALAGWAATLRARSVPLEVRGASALLQRMWRILGFDEVAPVTFAAARA